MAETICKRSNQQGINLQNTNSSCTWGSERKQPNPKMGKVLIDILPKKTYRWLRSTGGVSQQGNLFFALASPIWGPGSRGPIKPCLNFLSGFWSLFTDEGGTRALVGNKLSGAWCRPCQFRERIWTPLEPLNIASPWVTNSHLSLLFPSHKVSLPSWPLGTENPASGTAFFHSPSVHLLSPLSLAPLPPSLS